MGYAESRRARQAAAAAPRREGRTVQRASQYHGAASPRAPGRTRQHPHTPAPADLRLESRVAHAAAAGRRDGRAASRDAPPPSSTPRGSPGAASGASFRAQQRTRPTLGPIVVDSSDDAVSCIHSARAASKHFCHSLLEPISKSFKQYQQGCELHKTQEVVRIVLPARHNTALPLEPGKKALDLPPPRVAT